MRGMGVGRLGGERGATGGSARSRKEEAVLQAVRWGRAAKEACVGSMWKWKPGSCHRGFFGGTHYFMT